MKRPPILRPKLRHQAALAAVALWVVLEIVVFSPASVEESDSDVGRVVDPATLAQIDDEPSLAPGVPKGQVPDYAVDEFNYVSTHAAVKQWKLLAKRAFLYHHDHYVHGRDITAYLYGSDGGVTVVTGREAQYYMEKRDLEMFGNVHAVFADGFEMNSEYMRYFPGLQRIKVPLAYRVSGHGLEGAKKAKEDGTQSNGQNVDFECNGVDFPMSGNEITLPKDVRFVLTRPDSGRRARETDQTPGVPDRTVIDADHCLVNRDQELAHFSMNPQRPDKERLVHITQPKLFSRGRRADMNYGDLSQLLQYLVIYDDVLLKEVPEGQSEGGSLPERDDSSSPPLRYATAGRADFDTHKDQIVLTKQPQVYQGGDTVTGEVVVMHRDTDIVEVEHSNAFNEGK